VYLEAKGEVKITVFDLIGRCPDFDRIGVHRHNSNAPVDPGKENGVKQHH